MNMYYHTFVSRLFVHTTQLTCADAIVYTHTQIQYAQTTEKAEQKKIYEQQQ